MRSRGHSRGGLSEDVFLNVSTPVGNMSALVFDKTPSPSGVSEREGAPGAAPGGLCLQMTFVSPTGHSFAPVTGQQAGLDEGRWRSIAEFRGFDMGDVEIPVALRRPPQPGGSDDDEVTSVHSSVDRRRRALSLSTEGSIGAACADEPEFNVSSPHHRAAAAGAADANMSALTSTWAASGSTAKVVTTTLARCLAGDTGERSLTRDMDQAAALPTVSAGPPMAFKTVHHAGIQGDAPAQRDAEFAVRAIEFQTSVAITRRIDPEDFNIRLAFQHGIVLPAAVRVQHDTTDIVMPWMPGGSVGDLIRAYGGAPISRRIARQVIRGVVCGLDVLHRYMRAVHHDLTPENVLLASAGVGSPHSVDSAMQRSLDPAVADVAVDRALLCAAIADYGCTTLLGDGDGEDCSTTDFVGSVRYMSPERLAGEPHGPSSDVWSLGVVALSMALGRYPFLEPGVGSLPSDSQRAAGSDSSPLSTSDAPSGAAPPDDSFWRLSEAFAATQPDMTVRQGAVAAAVDAALLGCREVDPGWRSVVTACLQADPRHRPAASELLQAPFLSLVDPLVTAPVTSSS